MPKKSFKDNPALAFIGSGQAAADDGGEQGGRAPQAANETPMSHSPQEAQGVWAGRQAHEAHETAPGGVSGAPSRKHYRINLKLKAEYKQYLARASWEARKSVTQYLNDLVEADMASRL